VFIESRCGQLNKLTKQLNIMPKGIASGRWGFALSDKEGKKGCEYENGTRCDLPKFKRCIHCIRCVNGDKACGVTAF